MRPELPGTRDQDPRDQDPRDQDPRDQDSPGRDSGDRDPRDQDSPGRDSGDRDPRDQDSRARDPRDPRDESQAERDDRNLAELLQELRISGLGVQVLFGFLLSLPFTAKFGKLSNGQRDLYLVSLVLSTVATALLLGPVAYHRLVFRRRLKEPLVRAASTMATLGLGTVGLAISAAVLLAASTVTSGLAAVIITVCVVVLFASLWFALPLARRDRGS